LVAAERSEAALGVVRYIWDTEDQQEVLASIVQEAIARSAAIEGPDVHPRARGNESPDIESLARDLEQIGQRLGRADFPATERVYLKDRLGVLAGRCQWVSNAQQRTFLQQQVDALWGRMGESP
jgi:MoxR-like ATPase